MTPEFIAAFVFGCVFVTALLVIAIIIPEPTIQQMFIFRVVLALAAGGVGAVIPGFFTIQGEVLKFTLQAGGALALFAIIFLINPPSLVTSNARSALPKPKRPVKIKVPPHSRKETPMGLVNSEDPIKDERSAI